MKTTFMFAWVILGFTLSVHAQQSHYFDYDDRTRAECVHCEANPDVLVSLPGTQQWHIVTNQYEESDDHESKVTVSPTLEDMGSVQLQLMVVGNKACSGDATYKCTLVDVTWVWINHVKPTGYPIVCTIRTSPTTVSKGYPETIIPGTGPQEREYHYVYEAGVESKDVGVFQQVSCNPQGNDYDGAHHKCNPGEVNHCIASVRTLPKPTPRKRGRAVPKL